jgi:hypothetical protein
MRAVQITRFGGPEVLDVVDLPDPTPGDGRQLYEVSAAGVNFADTHHRLSPYSADGQRAADDASHRTSCDDRQSLHLPREPVRRPQNSRCALSVRLPLLEYAIESGTGSGGFQERC